MKHCLPTQEMLRDADLTPGSGRSPGGGYGNPLYYSCLENVMDRGAWWAVRTQRDTKSGHTWRGRAHTHAKILFSSVAQPCPILSHLTDCSTPGFPRHHQLADPAQNVRHVGDAIQPSHPLSSPSPPPTIFPSIRVFFNEQFFTPGGQSIGASASASVLLMNIQYWFPLGWTGLIFLQSKGLSRVFSSTTDQKHQFFGSQLSLWSNSHIHTWLLEKS